MKMTIVVEEEPATGASERCAAPPAHCSRGECGNKSHDGGVLAWGRI